MHQPLPTAAEAAAALAQQAEAALDRAMDPHANEACLEAARQYMQEGRYSSARLAAKLFSLNRRLDAMRAEQLRTEAAEAAARAERVAAIRASGQRMALPELRAGLRTAAR